MILEMVTIGVFIIIAALMICVRLRDLNDTLVRNLKRYAALENLGLFPEEDEKEHPGYGERHFQRVITP